MGAHNVNKHGDPINVLLMAHLQLFMVAPPMFPPTTCGLCGATHTRIVWGGMRGRRNGDAARCGGGREVRNSCINRVFLEVPRREDKFGTSSIDPALYGVKTGSNAT